MSPRRRATLIGGLALGCGAWRRARALEVPSAEPLLTVVGRVRSPNRGDKAVFDTGMLRRMQQADIFTRTPWYSTARKFTGPLVRDVLAAAGARGQKVQAIALNDYRVEIPFDDLVRYDVVLAHLLDGKPMPVRDKGPLFIMYPFDRQPELRTAVYFSRCAWQLTGLEVL
ncbi:molybdopterin-dependent oxidoreductase [Aquincola sp. MAHUQ-54]|uniref:Molybdopterin-dependent oxidoreductase n=1 Tax=Aquincola agrisoli TaxID=3119538 RepID=A0AAW9QBF7_9BURK